MKIKNPKVRKLKIKYKMCANFLGWRPDFQAQSGMILLSALNSKTYPIDVLTNNWKPLIHESSHFATGSTRFMHQETADTFPGKICWDSTTRPFSTKNKTGHRFFFANQTEENLLDKSC
jgi:hypothetical protein